MSGCQVLVATVEPSARRLGRVLHEAGYLVLTADDADAALALWRSRRPAIILIEWPRCDISIAEFCRHMRARNDVGYTYLLVLAPPGDASVRIELLRAGADACLDAAASEDEVLAGVAAGARLMARLNAATEKVDELARALDRAQDSIRDVVSVCVYCGKVKDNSGAWRDLSEHLSRTTGAEVSHGYCPECFYARGFDRWLDEP